MKRSIAVGSALLILLALGVTANSFSGLTDGRAAEQIKADSQFARLVTVKVQPAREFAWVESPHDSIELLKARAFKRYRANNDKLAQLENAGLLKIVADDGDTNLDATRSLLHFFNFEPILTPTGEALARRYKLKDELPIARRELMDVVEIAQERAGSADVEFTYREVPVGAGEMITPVVTVGWNDDPVTKNGSALMMDLEERGWSTLFLQL